MLTNAAKRGCPFIHPVSYPRRHSALPAGSRICSRVPHTTLDRDAAHHYTRLYMDSVWWFAYAYSRGRQLRMVVSMLVVAKLFRYFILLRIHRSSMPEVGRRNCD